MMNNDCVTSVEAEFESTSINLDNTSPKTGNVKRFSLERGGTPAVPQHCSKADGLDNFELLIKNKGASTSFMMKTKRQQCEKERIFAQQQHRYQNFSTGHYRTAVMNE